ncbi:MAG: hypothetical protein KatS3mg057_1502 [Herpetosiphonaceae bacterium]|nr:MAG: hypothetical protein KatS3mg057_1502 [Herpetosiphonaceae bacterium]
MYQQTYKVERRTGTSADILEAGGLAALLREILRKAGKPSADVLLIDSGTHYTIQLPAAIEAGDVETLEHPPPIVRHLDLDRKQDGATEEEAAMPAKRRSSSADRHAGYGFNYNGEMQRRKVFMEQLKQLPPHARSPHAFLSNAPELQARRDQLTPPSPELPLYAAINQFKKDVVESFNKTCIRWRELSPELLREHVRLVLTAFATLPNPLAEVEMRYAALARQHRLDKVEMTLLQVINPTTGKGANKSKASGVAIGQQSGWWVLELLKFAGYFLLAHAQTLQGSKERQKDRQKDLKIYIVRPGHISLRLLEQLMPRFRDALWSSTPVKQDVQAGLYLA